MKKILKKLTFDHLFWIIFIFGALIGNFIILLIKDSKTYMQPGAGFIEIFVNNFKVALLIIVTGMLTNMILPFLILLLNGIFWGMITAVNLQIIGLLSTLLFCIHVPFELLSFCYSFRLSATIYQAIFYKKFKKRDFLKIFFWMLFLLTIAASIEAGEFYFFRKSN
ncbi:MAG: stage II sporulation protein M [Streptococcaceae bacterium]|jgi:uncharacterized membrane protein SpoIIM required for sporulation|nr:stage II sporulation protein M [Streptococcaceae bacterium]